MKKLIGIESQKVFYSKMDEVRKLLNIIGVEKTYDETLEITAKILKSEGIVCFEYISS